MARDSEGYDSSKAAAPDEDRARAAVKQKTRPPKEPDKEPDKDASLNGIANGSAKARAAQISRPETDPDILRRPMKDALIHFWRKDGNVFTRTQHDGG